MPNKNYLKGTKFEYSIKSEIETKMDGVVIRAAGSGIGSKYAVDLLVMGSNKVSIIQCKSTNKTSIDIKDELIKMNDLFEKTQAHIYLAVKFKSKKPRFYKLEDIKKQSISVDDSDYLSLDYFLSLLNSSE